MIWNEEYESMPREELEVIQAQRLQQTVRWAYERVAHYKRAFDEAGISPKEITSAADVSLLPFTVKDDFRKNYPYEMFALPMDKVVRVHASSGTTGKPIVVGYSRGDISTWSECTARVATAAGVTSRDLAQVAFGYGLFTGGFGMHQGLERIGASVIPVSAGNTERQLTLMRDFRSTVLVSTPSYALHIAEVGAELGIDFNRDLPLRVGLFGGEPWSEAMRHEIEERLAISATDNWGLTEVMGPGVSGECEAKDGLHLNEDHFIFEIIDPETGESLPDGAEGEMVVTPITREACPVLRYRTRDLTRIIDEPCSCGRTTRRMARVHARTDDMLIIRGVNLFPSQIEHTLLDIEGVEPHYLIIVDRVGSMDQLEIQVEMPPQIFPDEMKKFIELEKKVQDKLMSVIGLKAKVKFVEPKTLGRFQGKAKRVEDRRQK